MSFVMNIGDDLNLLSLRCCCLYFKWNLPLLLYFLFGQKLLYLPIINFIICHILRILQLCPCSKCGKIPLIQKKSQ